jgi:hypothetical protein
VTQLNLGEEIIQADEAEIAKELAQVQVAVMRATKPKKRGQHPKQHGCVDAEFLVRADIPQKYKAGLFSESKTYKAVVRWSNGASDDDTVADVHGMAVKVLGVKGEKALAGDAREEQDFILIDSEVFFAPDAKTVLNFMKARIASAAKPAVLAEFAQNNRTTMALLAASLQIIPSPLAVRYWSTVPFKLGDGAVKYVAIPADGNTPAKPRPMSKHYLREAMVEHLTAERKSVVFELCIIPQLDATMPIEDPTVRWGSEPVPVATIRVEAQEFAGTERLYQCEDASFDPWNALAEHRPLGGINRARKAVYPESVLVRRTTLTTLVDREPL